MPYLTNGLEVEVIDPDINGQVLVKMCWQVDYDPETGGGLYTEGLSLVDQVFDAAPVQRFHAEIAGLELTIRERRAELSEVTSQLRSARSSTDQVRESIAMKGVLGRIDDAIHGRFTHLLLVGEYSEPLEVVGLKDLACKHSYHDGVRLLSLFGNSNGDLSWNLNRYKDDSGSWTEVIPFCSYESAVGHGITILEGWLADAEFCERWIERVIKSHENLKLDTPKALLFARDAKRAAQKEDRAAKLESELLTLRGEIKEINDEHGCG